MVGADGRSYCVRVASAPAGRRWLFLVHTLDRVGPPVYLAHLLTWIAAHDDVALDVVAMEDGPVRALLPARARVSVVPRPHAPGAAARLSGRADPDLICVHTVATAELLAGLPSPGTPVVTHAHEMSVGLDLHLPPRARHQALGRTDHWIAASGAVAGALGDDLGVDPASVTVHHEMVVPPATAPDPDGVRAALGLAPGTRLAGCVAILSWRKGPDLFLSLAREVVARADDVHLLWIGGTADDPSVRAFLAERDDAGLAGRVHHVPTVEDPAALTAALDVFVLTAREDAYPLAALDAAALGVPIVCFAAGGLPELVEPGAGVVVPYPDVAALADATLGLLDDPAARAAAGATAARRVAERHVPEVAGPRVHADLVRWERPR